MVVRYLHAGGGGRELTVFPWEEGFPFQHLGEDASCAPYIDRDVVFLPGQHDFRCAIVSGGNVTRHLWVLDSRQAKVTDLEIMQARMDTTLENHNTFRSQFSFTRMLLGF
jgi:hypothetical protein